MKSIGLLYIVFVVTFGFAQPPDTLWTKTYGGALDDMGNSIQQTPDGGYIIAGYTESFGAGQQDVWLLKTDANGDTIWTKTYGGPNDDWATAVRLTSDGGYVVLAITKSENYDGDIWLIKTDQLGDTTWTKNHGLPDGRGYDVRQTSDGGYIITGSADTNWLQGGIQLLKTDANGDLIWRRSWGPTNYGSAGQSVRETFDGGFIIAGWFNTGPGPRQEGGTALLIKTNEDGNEVWRSYQYEIYTFRSVEQTADSGYVACGYSSYSNPYLSLVRTYSHGLTYWMRTYGSYTNQMEGYSLDLTSDNAYVFTGACGDDIENNPDIFLFKTDENGDSLWCLSYGGAASDSGNEVQQTDDGGYIVVGSTGSFGAGGLDVWLLKFEPEVVVEENRKVAVRTENISFVIFSGPLLLPADKNCRVFDITGRVVTPDKIRPGIYFIEVDGVVIQKVVKIR